MNQPQLKLSHVILSGIAASIATWFIGALFTWSLEPWYYVAGWVFAFLIGVGKSARTDQRNQAEQAQIEMNERQKKKPEESFSDETPGVHFIDEDLYDEPEEGTRAVSPKRKERGDLPKAPPPSNNWPT